MPTWKVTGADRETGDDRVIEIDAPNEEGAVRQAGKSMFICNVARGAEPLSYADRTLAKPVPALPVDEEPSVGYRQMNPKHWVWICAVIGLAFVGVIALVVAVRSPAQTSAAFVATVSPVAKPTRLTTSEVTHGLQGIFKLRAEKDIDGTPLAFGEEIGGDAVLRIDGESDNVHYAHIGFTLGRLSDKEIMQYRIMMNRFVDNVAPDFAERQSWLQQAFSTRGARRQLSDRRLTMLLEDETVKLSVRMTNR